MPLKSQTKWISPRQYFPPHEAIARAVARLCILREDLYLEFLALSADEIRLTLPNAPEPFPQLDDNGPEYRRIYFLRASLRTLAEVYQAVSGLHQNQDFRKLYRKFSQAKFQ